MGFSVANYTTGNEIAYLLELEARGKWDILRNTLAGLDNRRWDGDGMAVDIEKVRRTLKKILARAPKEHPHVR
jgi:hypothetical protein